MSDPWTRITNPNPRSHKSISNIDYAPMQDLSIDIKHMPMAFGGYQYLLVIACDQTNFTIVTPLRSRDVQSVAEALIYRVIYLFGPTRQIICDEAARFTSHIVQAILHMLNCKLKVISPYNHDSSKEERQIKTMAAYANNTFTSEALNGFSLFQLVFVHDPLDLTSLSFPKIDTIPVAYYSLSLARAQMVGRLLLEWRTQEVL